MKILPFTCLCLVSASVLADAATSLDGEWEFSRDGGAYTKVTVPHDWAIAGPFKKDGSSATAKLPWKGHGVYRRTFTAKVPQKGGAVRLEFDGVMARPEVFVNGKKVGGWDYGYMSFWCDATAAVKDGENELEVRADTRDHGSRWYPGGGIYRSVRLVECKPGYTLPGSVFITTPKVTKEAAAVHVEWETKKGRREKTFTIENPVLWTPETPKLYSVKVNGREYRYGIRTAKFTAEDGFHLNGKRYQIKGANLHSDLGPLGMAFQIDAARRQLQLMKDMGCNAIRTAHNPPDPKFLDLCDEMGFLVWNECFDKWDETAGRRKDENLEEYVKRNLEAFVRRDRNHPSVICWSISNEIGPAWGENKDGQTKARLAAFAAAIRAIDPTRPVGNGNCHPEWFGDKSIFAALDVTGWNYQRGYAVQHGWNPKTQAVVMTESASAFSSRGFYGEMPPANKTDYATNVMEVSSFDSCAAPWADIPDVEFLRMERDRYCAGEFVWTGIDYLGEPSPYDYVIKGLTQKRKSRSSYFGCVDLTGVPKDRFYLYRSIWNKDRRTLHIVAAKGVGAAYVYTDSDEAELFADGVSLGRRKKAKDIDYPLDFRREWPQKDSCEENPYYAVCDKYRLRWFNLPEDWKELVAISYGTDGTETGRTRVLAPGKPERIAVECENQNGELLFFHLLAVDANGTLVTDARSSVSLKVTGPGKAIAVGNGDARGYESFCDTDSHSLYNGRALVIVRRTAAGEISLSATHSPFGE